MRREFVIEPAQANRESHVHENMGLLEKAKDRNFNCMY